MFLSKFAAAFTAPLYQAIAVELLFATIEFPTFGYAKSSVDVYKKYSKPSNEPIKLLMLFNCLLAWIVVVAVITVPSNCNEELSSAIIT